MNAAPTNVEDQISKRLAELAATAEVHFTIDDVVAGGSLADPDSPTQHRRHRRQHRPALPLVMAIATVAVITAGTFAWRAQDSGNETLTAPATEQGGPTTEPTTPTTAPATTAPAKVISEIEVIDTDEAAPPTTEPLPEPSPRQLDPTGDEPRQLGPGAVVMRPEFVPGLIEVGPPPETLVTDEPWLAGATCIATESAIGCGGGQGRAPAGPSTYGGGDGEGYLVMSAEGPDAPFVMIEEFTLGFDGSIIVSRLPAGTQRVVLGFSPFAFEQQPVEGTVAFGFPANAELLDLRALDSSGDELWSAVFQMPGQKIVATQAAATCEPTTIDRTTQEIQATTVEGESDGFEAWGLLFLTRSTPDPDVFQLKVGDELKVVWRVTGEGNAQFLARGPDDQTVDPTWAQHHGGSTWERPGDEWGTGWVLPEPGCWQLEITRETGLATVTVEAVEYEDGPPPRQLSEGQTEAG